MSLFLVFLLLYNSVQSLQMFTLWPIHSYIPEMNLLLNMLLHRCRVGLDIRGLDSWTDSYAIKSYSCYSQIFKDIFCSIDMSWLTAVCLCCDVYILVCVRSLGVLVYVLLTGFSPFSGETKQEMYLNISQVNLDFPSELFASISSSAVEFIKSLIIKNPM